MTIVEYHEARTRFSELLRAVERGETVTITRRGEPVARIVGAAAGADEAATAVIERIEGARSKRPSVTIEEILEMRDEDRRF